jgi:hypothetical protein
LRIIWESYYIIFNQMDEPGFCVLDAVSPLLRLANEREDLFFELLSFVNKNIECSSNDIDNITIFSRFLPPLK